MRTSRSGEDDLNIKHVVFSSVTHVNRLQSQCWIVQATKQSLIKESGQRQ